MLLLSKLECHRCHDGTGVADIGRDKHCVRCHQDILSGTFEAPAEALADWQRNIKSLVAVPSLAAIGNRLTRDWVRGHLLHPVDVRPALAASMPRLAISEAEADALAAQLVPQQPEALTQAAFGPDDARRGRELYELLGCDGCHSFTGVLPRREGGHYTNVVGAAKTVVPAPAAILLAPDLAHTRTRFQLARLPGWITGAPAIKPDTLMPAFGLSPADAHALAAFIVTTAVPQPPPVRPFERLPVLQREVAWEEVSGRVFRKICWHCHSSPDYARGDGGPGNSGGFGFPGPGLDLSSYTGIAMGSIGPDGRRRSVFTPLADGTPRLLAHLLARHAEERGTEMPGIRGMPLGLPALSPEDIQLVESWIAQGRPP